MDRMPKLNTRGIVALICPSHICPRIHTIRAPTAAIETKRICRRKITYLTMKNKWRAQIETSVAAEL